MSFVKKLNESILELQKLTAGENETFSEIFL